MAAALAASRLSKICLTGQSGAGERGTHELVGQTVSYGPPPAKVGGNFNQRFKEKRAAVAGPAALDETAGA